MSYDKRYTPVSNFNDTVVFYNNTSKGKSNFKQDH